MASTIHEKQHVDQGRDSDGRERRIYHTISLKRASGNRPGSGTTAKIIVCLFTNPKSETKLFVKKMRLRAKRREASMMPAQLFEPET
jgi:hypothetical protein